MINKRDLLLLPLAACRDEDDNSVETVPGKTVLVYMVA